MPEQWSVTAWATYKLHVPGEIANAEQMGFQEGPEEDINSNSTVY